MGGWKSIAQEPGWYSYSLSPLAKIPPWIFYTTWPQKGQTMTSTAAREAAFAMVWILEVTDRIPFRAVSLQWVWVYSFFTFYELTQKLCPNEFHALPRLKRIIRRLKCQRTWLLRKIGCAIETVTKLARVGIHKIERRGIRLERSPVD